MWRGEALYKREYYFVPIPVETNKLFGQTYLLDGANECFNVCNGKEAVQTFYTKHPLWHVPKLTTTKQIFIWFKNRFGANRCRWAGSGSFNHRWHSAEKRGRNSSAARRELCIRSLSRSIRLMRVYGESRFLWIWIQSRVGLTWIQTNGVRSIAWRVSKPGPASRNCRRSSLCSLPSQYSYRDGSRVRTTAPSPCSENT